MSTTSADAAICAPEAACVACSTGGGMSADWMSDPYAAAYLAAVKALLDEVNVEDKGCVEKVYRGLVAGMSAPGPLSHLERPNFEFAQYIASKVSPLPVSMTDSGDAA
jgi:hypothetical protein